MAQMPDPTAARCSGCGAEWLEHYPTPVRIVWRMAQAAWRWEEERGGVCEGRYRPQNLNWKLVDCPPSLHRSKRPCFLSTS